MKRLIQLIPAICILLLAGCDNMTDTAPVPNSGLDAASASTIDISGVWNQEEKVYLTFPGEVAGPLFQVDPEGPVLHVNCIVFGTFAIDQAGADFTYESITTAGSCTTRGGQVATPPFPPGPNTGSGTINGRSFQLVADPDGAGVHCTKNGTVKTVSGGVAGEIHSRGRCDVGVLGFRPANARNESVFTRL